MNRDRQTNKHTPKHNHFGGSNSLNVLVYQLVYILLVDLYSTREIQ